MLAVIAETTTKVPALFVVVSAPALNILICNI